MSESTALAIQETPTPGRYVADAQRVYFDRADALADIKKASKSANTLRGYESDWQQFRTWGIAQAIDIPTPGDLTEAIPPALVLSYLADRRHQVTSATLGRHLAAIRYWHRQARMISPTDHPDVAETLAGIVRLHQYDTDLATPVYLDNLARMVARCGSGPLGLRNRALLLLGWWAGLRRSELVGLDLGHITQHPSGILLKLPKSKTDQAGVGRKVAVNTRPTESLCAVVAVREWVGAASISNGPVFRCIDRWGHVSAKRLSGQAVAMVVKESAATIGLDPAMYSGHSLRAGHVSEASRQGVPKMAIRAVTGHTSDSMIDHYGRPEELFEHSSGAYMVDPSEDAKES